MYFEATNYVFRAKFTTPKFPTAQPPIPQPPVVALTEVPRVAYSNPHRPQATGLCTSQTPKPQRTNAGRLQSSACTGIPVVPGSRLYKQSDAPYWRRCMPPIHTGHKARGIPTCHLPERSGWKFVMETPAVRRLVRARQQCGIFSRRPASARRQFAAVP